MNVLKYYIGLELPYKKVGQEANREKDSLWEMVDSVDGPYRRAKELFYGFKISENEEHKTMIYSMQGVVDSLEEFLKPFSNLSNEIITSENATEPFKDAIAVANYLIGDSISSIKSAMKSKKSSISRTMYSGKSDATVKILFESEEKKEVPKKSCGTFTGNSYRVLINYKESESDEWYNIPRPYSVIKVADNEHGAITNAVQDFVRIEQERISSKRIQDFEIVDVSVEELKKLNIPLYKK